MNLVLKPSRRTGNTPLHFAAALNSSRLLKKLLLYGANPGARNGQGQCQWEGLYAQVLPAAPSREG